MKKIYIIAGEASGDLHGSNLVKSINKISPNITWKGWGGNLLAAEGVNIDVRCEEANFMGFVEVLANIFKILKLFKLTKKSILEFKPDALLLIDYPGFNLRMAVWAHSNKIPVYYYIAPQVWAWKESRVNILRNCIKKLYVILPFEKEYFKKHNINAEYYGHPLLNTIQNFINNPEFRIRHNLNQQEIIALLPGSRIQEIKNLLPIFLKSLANETEYQIVIAGLIQHKELYYKIISEIGIKVNVVYNDTYNLLYNSKAALVTSGTATLETALFKVPQVICYKGNILSYYIAKQLVKVPYISLVNLIAQKKIVTELIQSELSLQNVKMELYKLLKSESRNIQLKEYELLFRVLSNSTSDLANNLLLELDPKK
ncbi:MAG: lipid-A-disaccharide synthase [Saprospiraceae bacterium]|nr:lipid-A-disaccharide synthase [Saprospiraceae bacterium]